MRNRFFISPPVFGSVSCRAYIDKADFRRHGAPMPDLSEIIRAGVANPWLYLPFAVVLGALHALEPGHSKSLMAAFIIGSMLGMAGAIAGATSMAAGEWVSISAQNEMVYRELAVERRELVHNTASETDELAKMYEGHGMTRQIALDAAADVMRVPEAALAVHVREELGVDPNELGSPWSAAGLSLICFLVGALLPVIPWFAGRGNGAKVASILIGVGAAALVGLAIGRFAERRMLWSSARQVLILLVACGATWLVGNALGVSVS